MNRSSFIKQSVKAGAMVLINPLPRFLFAGPLHTGGKGNADQGLLERLVQANDVQVEELLQSDFDSIAFSRKTGQDFTTLTASYCSPASRYYQSATIVSALRKLAQHLLRAQAADGTVNIGNLESPPDTAFLIELVTAAAFLLQKEKSAALENIKYDVRIFLLQAGEALVAGGVHTPNHRWVVSAALARLNALYPAKKYVERIDEWLSEGIFINPDGNYPERSRIYSHVENNAFITMARLLARPALLAPVRKNLETTYYYTEPDGDLITTDSRRQDQYSSKNIADEYLLYRYMAIREANGFFAAIVKMIEGLKGFDEKVLTRALAFFLEEPLLQNELPAVMPLPLDYEKLFAHSHLLRIRRNEVTATLFGGVDWPMIIASGRSNSPNFFSYRKGAAVLKYMRLSTSFFSTGYFYSKGLKKEDGKYVLSNKSAVPYYQPLPKSLRKADGDYRLSESIDGRFWNKMDFRHRPVSNVKIMEIRVVFEETAGRTGLLFDIKGQAGVQVTIELCFKEGGKLSGAITEQNGTSLLKEGMGRYEFGGDAIEFGPGVAGHKSIANLEGEQYSSHFGTLRTEGMHVFLTGVTPFTHKLAFH